MNAILFGKIIFANEIKAPEMRKSWIIQVGPNSNGKCPCKREAVRDLRQKIRHRHTEERGYDMRTEAVRQSQV